ncbi:formamidopyrimidine-DNA glycosylase [Evansella caseinilytica]|uniref:Formamidopyrimidine-DNA glycosylase n=1 Tax=Evansella caseinilytica TaxID=1503961 RepID=A0A1H3RV67_9BACI|nr:hypothetical protein [Evansella caseinilytica]SDZ29151.1 formamidopyrimidine-DNA glycosylase [Evansella caseinilytica]
MIELPETYVLAHQINRTLAGKVIRKVTANASPHKFAWYSGDPMNYDKLLNGRKITGANPGTEYTCGASTEILAEDTLMVISTPIKYHPKGEKLPKKHQLLIEFDDFSHMSCTVQMWGAMLCYPLEGESLAEEYKVNRCLSPLSEAFDYSYFERLLEGHENLSAKAFLATEQRIPGLGNGILQDILFHACIHPKRRMNTLSEREKRRMFHAVKDTIDTMVTQGGRDTERSLFGCPGGYQTILSKKTINKPCPVCEGALVREAYLGGNIYYCPTCQPCE